MPFVFYLLSLPLSRVAVVAGCDVFLPLPATFTAVHSSVELLDSRTARLGDLYLRRT